MIAHYVLNVIRYGYMKMNRLAQVEQPIIARYQSFE